MLKVFLICFYVITVTTTCVAQVSSQQDPLAAALKLRGKEFLFQDTNTLDELPVDQFLERIQFDFTRHLLRQKSDIAITENDGYRISLFCVAVKNGWLTRHDAAKMTLQYLREFWNAKTASGFFPRSFYRATGEKTNESYGEFGQPYDVVGTAFFVASAQLCVAQFFDKSNSIETEIRLLCQQIFDRIDWDFAFDTSRTCFTWFKVGEHGEKFGGKELRGEMDETFFLQFLAMGSTKWSYGKLAYNEFTKSLPRFTQYGYSFWSTKENNYKNSEQFSGIRVLNSDVARQRDYPIAKLGYLVQPHVWFDFRGYRDSLCTAYHTDYFKNVQNVIAAQIKYTQINPGNYPLYGDVWGFYDTYSPLSKKWMITGLPAEGDIDEGTISLNAALSALPFMPQQTLHCIKTLYENFLSDGIYRTWGFATSVNVKTRETAPEPEAFFMPINVLLIENFRSGLLWKLSSKSKLSKEAFSKAGLTKVGEIQK